MTQESEDILIASMKAARAGVTYLGDIETVTAIISGFLASVAEAFRAENPEEATMRLVNDLALRFSVGVEGLDATVFSHFNASEREVIIKNNVRYLVLKAETHKNWVDSEGVSHGKKNIVDVIALPHED